MPQAASPGAGSYTLASPAESPAALARSRRQAPDAVFESIHRDVRRPTTGAARLRLAASSGVRSLRKGESP